MINPKYTLSTYIKDWKDHGIEAQIHGLDASVLERKVQDLSYDSREIQEGGVFICKGAHFEKKYLEQAIERGAFAYIAQEDYQVDIPCVRVENVRSILGLAAQRFFDFPQRQLQLIGITGTKGKSTTTQMLRAILSRVEEKQGRSIGWLSSIDCFNGKELVESHLTTPEPIELYRILAQCRDHQVRYVILETSSQALKYGRLEGLSFDYAALLNINEDHISPSEHPTKEDYVASKLRLFSRAKRAWIGDNIQDIAHLEERMADAEQVFYVRDESDPPAEHVHDYVLRLTSVFEEEKGLVLALKEGEETQCLRVPLLGRFNAENALFASAIARSIGITWSQIQEGMDEVYVDGRMQLFTTPEDAVNILVDYAHNQLSFEKVFQAMHSRYPEHRWVAIFGAGGYKAQNRRATLTGIASRYVAECILVMDDPGYEPIEAINADLGRYLDEKGCPWRSIPDRSEAIQAAFAEACARYQETGEKTLIFALGKGGENTQNIEGKAVPYHSDMDTAKDCVEQKRW